MVHINNFKLKMVLTLLFSAAVAVMWMLDAKCIFLSLFHFPCPSCGMTRAWMFALRLDFAGAMAYHPMFWSVPLLYLYLLFDGRLFGKKALDRTVLITVAVGFAVTYVYRLAVADSLICL